MILPISTDLPRRRPTVVTYWLIAMNVAVFMLEFVIGRQSPSAWDRWFGYGPGNGLLVLQAGAGFEFRWWAIFTYQFLHGGLLHLLGNMLFLFVFGPNVEDRLTRFGFVALYLLGGAAAGGAHLFIDRSMGDGPAPVIGASGAIAAVTGAFLVLFPLVHIRALLFFFFIGVYMFPAWWLIVFAIAKDLLYQGLGGSNGVANVAHLGGYAFGSGVSFLLLGTRLVARQPYDLLSIARHAHRRRQFRELTSKSAGASPWRADPPTARLKSKTRGAVSERESRLNERRTDIMRRAQGGNVAGAAQVYLDTLDEFGDVVVNRDAQLAIGNHLMGDGRHQQAAVAYRLFIERFPKDPEAPRIRLMLAVVCGRYLNDPIEAKRLLGDVQTALLSAEESALAEALRKELA